MNVPLGIALTGLLTGCGGAGLANLADPMYEIARLTCSNAEELIIRRPGTTEANDLADLAKIRGRCDRIFKTFEALADDGVVETADDSP